LRYDLLLTKTMNDYLKDFQTNYPSKAELIKAWSDWFESKREDWDLFTLTVVFKTSKNIPRTYDWPAEYERVLNKIRRRLERNPANYVLAIPFDQFAYYEKNEASIKRVTGSRKPHHFHAVIPIHKERAYRFWSIDYQDVHPKLRSDIESIDTVQSIVVEPILTNRTIDWTSYILKAKSL